MFRAAGCNDACMWHARTHTHALRHFIWSCDSQPTCLTTRAATHARNQRKQLKGGAGIVGACSTSHNQRTTAMILAGTPITNGCKTCDAARYAARAPDKANQATAE